MYNIYYSQRLGGRKSRFNVLQYTYTYNRSTKHTFKIGIIDKATLTEVKGLRTKDYTTQPYKLASEDLWPLKLGL